MANLDHSINRREKVLNWILRVNPNSILNSRSFPPEGNSGISSPVGDIKVSINQLKSLVLAENGKVDYQKLVRDPQYKSFRELVGELGDFDYQILGSRDERLAFWINLYNALVIDAVIQEKVQASVTESWLGIMSFFQKAAYRVNGLRPSLTNIEHGLLRGNRGFPYFPSPHFSPSDPRLEAVLQPIDPRIHFALNCASNSCPPIGVYTPEKIQDQLDLAARNFINSDLIANPDQKMISISKIFKWYQDDFGGELGIIAFLVKFIDDQKIGSWLSENQTSIRIQYHPYDWRLNKVTS